MYHLYDMPNKLKKYRRKTPPKQIQSGVKFDDGYYIIWASGFRCPNWVAFGCKAGLIEAYRHEKATINCLEKLIEEDPKHPDVINGYSFLEMRSHLRILKRLFPISEGFGAELNENLLEEDEYYGKIRFNLLGHSWFTTALSGIPAIEQVKEKLNDHHHRRALLSPPESKEIKCDCCP